MHSVWRVRLRGTSTSYFGKNLCNVSSSIFGHEIFARRAFVISSLETMLVPRRVAVALCSASVPWLAWGHLALSPAPSSLTLQDDLRTALAYEALAASPANGSFELNQDERRLNVTPTPSPAPLELRAPMASVNASAAVDAPPPEVPTPADVSGIPSNATDDGMADDTREAMLWLVTVVLILAAASAAPRLPERELAAESAGQKVSF